MISTCLAGARIDRSAFRPGKTSALIVPTARFQKLQATTLMLIPNTLNIVTIKSSMP